MTCFEIMCFILKTHLPFISKECWYLCDMSSYIKFCRNMYNILQYYLSKLHSSKSFSDIFDQRRILSMSTLFWSIQACKAILCAERELINLYIFHYKLLSWYACVAHLPFFILFLLVSQCSDIFLLTIRTFFFLYSSIVFLYCNLLNLFQNSLSCPIFNNKLSICIRIHTSVNENTKRRVQAPHRDIVLWFRPYRVSQFIECVIQSFDSLSEALQIFASITTQILIRCATLIINNTEIAVIIIVRVFIELIVTVLANDICLGK